MAEGSSIASRSKGRTTKFSSAGCPSRCPPRETVMAAGGCCNDLFGPAQQSQLKRLDLRATQFAAVEPGQRIEEVLVDLRLHRPAEPCHRRLQAAIEVAQV